MGLSRFSKRKSLAALEFWEVVSLPVRLNDSPQLAPKPA